MFIKAELPGAVGKGVISAGAAPARYLAGSAPLEARGLDFALPPSVSHGFLGAKGGNELFWLLMHMCTGSAVSPEGHRCQLFSVHRRSWVLGKGDWRESRQSTASV